MKSIKDLFVIKFILVVGLSLAINSCSNKKSEKNGNNDMQMFKDSLARIEGDKAIGCINFDISEKQFKIELVNFLKSIEQVDSLYEGGSFYNYKIGSFILSENNVFTFFNRDSLVSVSFYSEYLVYSDNGYPRRYIEKGNYGCSLINDDFNSLVDIFSNKYGKPDELHVFNNEDEWMNFPDDFVTRDLAIWKIGRKTVKISYSKGHELYGELPDGDGIYINLYLSFSDENIRERIIKEDFNKMEIETQKRDSMQKAINKKKIEVL